jgi:phosphoglycerate dehydrogenase-like enzyme
MPKRVAILDDYQGAAASQPHWQRLADRIVLEVYRDTVQREDALIERLRPYSIVVAIRERTRFSASVLKQLPALELLSLTGRNSGQADMAAAREQKILVTQTEGSSASTIELTMAFILSVAHRVVEEDRAIRRGLWQTGIGFELAGKTLGVMGLGESERRSRHLENRWACACWGGVRILQNKKRARQERHMCRSMTCCARAMW